MINAIFVEGLIYAIMVLGVFITFRILDFPDLTVDGSFATGACVMAICIINGVDLYLAIGLAILGGILAGVCTALLHTQLKIPGLLAGIITMTMLYSINTRILGGKGFESINNKPNIVTNASEWLNGLLSGIFPGMSGADINSLALLIFFIPLVVLIKISLDVFFRMDLGISLGALGSNEQMILSQGINPNILKILGVGLSNGLVALSGAFFAQFSGSASNISGQGIVVIGLASVMIGEFLIRSNRIWLITLGIIAGSIIYKAIIFMGLKYGHVIGLGPNDLKLISGLLIIVIIIFSKLDKRKVYKSIINFRDKFSKTSVSEKVDAGDDTILTLDNVTKTFFPGTVNEKTVLKNLSLTINKGDFITIIGSNGAGKSTLFNTISGTYDVSGGNIYYHKRNITKMKEHKRAKFIGRIFQNPLLGTSGNMALEDNMILCVKKGMKLPVISLNKRVRALFKQHVARLNMGLENRLADNVGSFSGGQRQALTLLMTAMSHPQLVLLDEHTAALDPDNSNRVMDLTLQLRDEYDLTMMMITHNLQHAIKYGNRLIMMDNGEIILDISGEEKKNLTVEKIMEKFKAIRKDELNDEKLLLAD